MERIGRAEPREMLRHSFEILSARWWWREQLFVQRRSVRNLFSIERYETAGRGEKRHCRSDEENALLYYERFRHQQLPAITFIRSGNEWFGKTNETFREHLNVSEQVYLVQYGRDYYAMKVLRKNLVLEGQDLPYVMLEREILIRCRSCPFIIQLFYAFQNAERLFFLMEVARAGNYYRLLIKQAPKPFAYERIVFHVGEIVCALLFLHAKRIVRETSSIFFVSVDRFFLGLSRFETRKCSRLRRRPREIGRFRFVSTRHRSATASNDFLRHTGIHCLRDLQACLLYTSPSPRD